MTVEFFVELDVTVMLKWSPHALVYVSAVVFS
jgi:hypothetical protein